MDDKPRFRLIMSRFAKEFIHALPLSARKKIYYNIDKIQTGTINTELFKKLGNTDIWEFRTLYEGKAYRLFAFWDTRTDTLVVATHGIVKKTQKTPAKEIAKAESLRQLYFENPNNPTIWK